MPLVLTVTSAQLAEMIERFDPSFPSHAAVLEAAPRRSRIKLMVIVDPARPGADVRYALSHRVSFAHPVADLVTAEAAEQAGFAEGRLIINGTHRDGPNTEGL